MQRLREFFDPFLVLLIVTILIASFLPAQGKAAEAVEWAANAGIVLLFFLHGAKLSREAILSGAKAWKLHFATLGTTYAFFPILGIAMQSITALSPELRAGLLFMSFLPSTVQSSIAFTAIARGNVAAAVVSASFSNLLGMFLTPIMFALYMGMGKSVAGSLISYSAAEGIALQLLLPFIVGHFLRPWVGAFVARNKGWIGKVDRGSILLIVYSAFSAAVVSGLWHQVSRMELTLLVGISIGVLIAVLLFTWIVGKIMGLSKEDAIVLQFCGSKKSLATGVPIAGVLFPASIVGPIILPIMIFHQIQLIACAILARHYGNRTNEVER